MSKRIKDTDYLFITAFIRARESKLLTWDRMQRMIDAKSADDAARILEECGYSNLAGVGLTEFNKKVAAKRDSVLTELAPLVPDKALLNIFRVKYDYHNAKVMIKAEASHTDGTSLLSDSGRFPIAEFSDRYNKDTLSYLSELMADAVADAKDTLARTHDSQLADFILDKAYFREFKSLADISGSKFLAGYCHLMIDSANLRSTVRSMRMGKDASFLRNVLIDGGSVSPDRILNGLSIKASLEDIFSSTLLYNAAKSGDDAVSGGNLTIFEKLCDNALVAYMAKAKTVSFGEAVLIAYVSSVENECLAARIIMTGKLAGLSPEVIRERLRDSYV